MNDEHIVSLHSNMQFLLTRALIIVLRKVDEHVPSFRETMVTAVRPKKQNVFQFPRSQILRIILICVGFNVLCRFRGISMLISSMLVMIGHLRQIRHMY